LNTDDNELFYVGNNEDKKMIMPKQAQAIIISIGYKDEKPSLAVQEFQTGSKAKMTLSLKSSTLEKVEKAIGRYSYSKENQIGEDLKYMAAFYKAEKKQKANQGELDFLYGLLRFVEPCCFYELLSK
jgi:phage protein D